MAIGLDGSQKAGTGPQQGKDAGSSPKAGAGQGQLPESKTLPPPINTNAGAKTDENTDAKPVANTTTKATETAAAPSAVETEVAAREQALARFREAIKPHLPASKTDTAATQERLLGIFSAAFKELGGVEMPKDQAITLSLLNAQISKKGFGLTLDTSGTESKPTLENVRVVTFDPAVKPESFDAKRFQALVELTKYPEINIVSAKGQIIYHSGSREEGVVPGQVLIRDKSEPLVLVFPAEISKQEAIFKGQKVPLAAGAMTDAVKINEASHYLLEKILGDRPVEIEKLKIPIKGPIAINVPAFGRAQYHELFSDAATLKLTNDLPSALAMLGRQSDSDHATSFHVLNNSTVVALHLFLQDSPQQDWAARRQSIAGIITPKPNGAVHTDFDALARAMRKDPALTKIIEEIVVGVHTSVANGVLHEVLK